MVGTKKESGLSEVIGFILIIAILVVVASLYVTYVVPAHGREAEIEHMTYIKNQFVDFKMAMDSLWINSQVNTSLSQNIEMGTLGQKTEGQFVFLPLMQPIGSDGEMELSVDPSQGMIEIEILGLIKKANDLTPAGKLSTPIEINPDFYAQMLYYQAMNPFSVRNMIPIYIPNYTNIFNIPGDPNDFSLNQSESFNLVQIGPSVVSSQNENWLASFSLVRTPVFSVPY